MYDRKNVTWRGAYKGSRREVKELRKETEGHWVWQFREEVH